MMELAAHGMRSRKEKISRIALAAALGRWRNTAVHLLVLFIHFMICRSKKCHRPRMSSRYENSEVLQ